MFHGRSRGSMARKMWAGEQNTSKVCKSLDNWTSATLTSNSPLPLILDASSKFGGGYKTFFDVLHFRPYKLSPNCPKLSQSAPRSILARPENNKNPNETLQHLLKFIFENNLRLSLELLNVGPGPVSDHQQLSKGIQKHVKD